MYIVYLFINFFLQELLLSFPLGGAKWLSHGLCDLQGEITGDIKCLDINTRGNHENLTSLIFKMSTLGVWGPHRGT